MATTTPTSCSQSAWMTLPSSVRMATTATSSSAWSGVSWDPSAPASHEGDASCSGNNGLPDSAMMTLKMPRRRNSFDAFPKPKLAASAKPASSADDILGNNSDHSNSSSATFGGTTSGHSAKSKQSTADLIQQALLDLDLSDSDDDDDFDDVEFAEEDASVLMEDDDETESMAEYES